ncbi:CLIP domain-containing serine protease B9-like [Armigeres subalbatus]|uniref:CLIP domain-containing serine protease B9-like n=1 Tax=Armigeres subalbatus TaxID=124917 RepID=UPI002ED0B7EF
MNLFLILFVQIGVSIVACRATDNVFNMEGCGPNHYGEILSRPTIGRLKEFPWMARLGYRNPGEDSVEYLFQGSLIHPRYVLTTVFAAGYRRNTLDVVRLGDYHTETDEDCQEVNDDELCAPPPQDIAVQQIIRNPSYNKPRLANDLALLKLVSPVNVTTEFVRPICIPTDRDIPLNEFAALFISAWCGSVKSGISVIPMQYRMQLISSSICAEKLAPHVHIDLDRSQFCAVVDLDKQQKAKIKDLNLRGSTGAPLQMVGPDGRFYLMGMTSVGVRDAPLGMPYVFVHIPEMVEWLQQTVAGEVQREQYKLR